MIEKAMSALTEFHFTVLYEPVDEGGFTVTCPALPGLITEGDTLEEARGTAEDAIGTGRPSPTSALPKALSDTRR